MRTQWYGQFTGATFLLLACIASPPPASAAPPSADREVSATVQAFRGDLIAVKTAERTTRYFTRDEFLTEQGDKALQQGDSVVLVLDGGNQIVRVQRSEVLRSVEGTVKKIFDTLVSVDTEERTTRYFTLDQLQEEERPAIEPGDSVALLIDAGNQIVAVQRTEEPALLSGSADTPPDRHEAAAARA